MLVSTGLRTLNLSIGNFRISSVYSHRASEGGQVATGEKDEDGAHVSRCVTDKKT